MDNKQGGRPDSHWDIICLDGQMVDTFGQHNGGHRIRHYGLLASGMKADNLVLTRKLLDVAPPEDAASDPAAPVKP